MYDPTNRKLSKSGGLSIAEVAQCLAASSGDLGTLCVFPAINPLAKYKPVNLSLYTELTDAQRKSVNWGTGIPAIIADGKKPLDGDAWYHAKPTAVARLLDFDGYAHLATPPLGIGWNSGSAGQVAPIDWANDEVATVYLFMVQAAIGFVTGSLELSDLHFDGIDLDHLYFWVAVLAGNDVFLKRSDASIATIMARSASSRYELVHFYIKTTASHDADFDGDLRFITSDFSMQVFLGSASVYGQTLDDVNDIPHKFSLNCRGNMDVQAFGNIVAPWDKRLSVTMTTIPQLVLVSTGTHRLYVFQAAGAATFSRGALEEQSVQGFVYRVSGHFHVGRSGQGGFIDSGGHDAIDLEILAGTSMSVAAGASEVRTLGLLNQGVHAPVGETDIVSVIVQGARTPASSYRDLYNGSYVIFPDNTVLYPDGRRHNPDGSLYTI